ncbi:MAG: YtxH domain-containing protein [Chloroflexi bacterium]|nr:YtxH domain-containing protein [Chloroflexota bacterium]
MSSDSGAGDFLAGFFVGTLVGAAFALLFAPSTGEEMREQIRERGIELKERATEMGVDREKLGELKVRGEELLEQQRTRFMEAVQEGRLAAERRKEELLAQFQAPAPKDDSIDLTPAGEGEAS